MMRRLMLILLLLCYGIQLTMLSAIDEEQEFVIGSTEHEEAPEEPEHEDTHDEQIETELENNE